MTNPQDTNQIKVKLFAFSKKTNTLYVEYEKDSLSESEYILLSEPEYMNYLSKLQDGHCLSLDTDGKIAVIDVGVSQFVMKYLDIGNIPMMRAIARMKASDLPEVHKHPFLTWRAGTDFLLDFANYSKSRVVKLTALRNAALADLDVVFMKALEKNTSTKEIVDKKQVLRDLLTAVRAEQDPQKFEKLYESARQRIASLSA